VTLRTREPATIQVEEAYVEVAGTRTHYHSAGDGPIVLLLHGSGPGVSAWVNWRLLIPALAGSFRVIAPDQLGFGKTDAPADGRYGRSAWTAHAVALLDALGVDRCSVVGNSMGGAIALSLAAEHPARIERIVTMGTTGVKMSLSDGLDRVWGYRPSREAMRELIELFAHDQSIVTDELVQARYEQSLEPATRESYEAMFPGPRQRWLDDLALSEDELGRLPQPVLLIHGRDDRVIPLAESTLRLLDVLPAAEAHIFGSCGHWVQLEQTERFNAVVGDFLAAGRDVS
jgi:2-hydroxymuconate-semialdehyde hydrolase